MAVCATPVRFHLKKKTDLTGISLASVQNSLPLFFICGLAGSRIVGTEANFAVKRDWSLISQRESTSFNLFKSLHGQNRVIIGILSN